MFSRPIYSKASVAVTVAFHTLSDAVSTACADNLQSVGVRVVFDDDDEAAASCSSRGYLAEVVAVGQRGEDLAIVGEHDQASARHEIHLTPDVALTDGRTDSSTIPFSRSAVMSPLRQT